MSDVVRQNNEAMGIIVYQLNVDANDGRGEQPCLWFQRQAFGRKMAYVLPLSIAYLLADDETLMERAFICGRELNLLNGVKEDDKQTIHKLMDLLTKHVDDLVQKIPPPPPESKIEIANRIDRSGIRSLKMNGKEMLH